MIANLQNLLLLLLPACGALSLGAPIMLSKGVQPWGRWEHTDEQISIHIYLGDKGTVLGDEVNRAMCCEVAEGFLCAYQDKSYNTIDEEGVWGGEGSSGEEVAGAPLIFGRLAQVVESRYLVWDVEEREGGRHSASCCPRRPPRRDSRASRAMLFSTRLFTCPASRSCCLGFLCPRTAPKLARNESSRHCGRQKGDDACERR